MNYYRIVGTRSRNTMWIKNLMSVLLLAATIVADHLKVEYEWKQIDFLYPSVEERQAAIASMNFIQENVIPVGLEVYKNRLFITLPRWKKGVPASLAYIDLNGKNLSLSRVCVWTLYTHNNIICDVEMIWRQGGRRRHNIIHSPHHTYN